MQIQISIDHSILSREALAARIGSMVENAMDRLSDHITRIEVHLSDKSARSGRNDKRFVMEARLQGRKPVAVTLHAAILGQAVGSAACKWCRLVESFLGRPRQGGTSG